MKHTQRPLVFFLVFIAQYVIAGTLSTNVNAATLSSSSVQSMVQSYFKDAPDMIEVAECESGFRQFDESGNVLRGGYNNDMIGVYQIDETVHRDAALAMGYDIYTFIGNILYTRYLYSKSGVDPWIGCIGNNLPTTLTTTTEEVEKGTVEKKETVGTTLSNFKTSDKEIADIIALIERFRELGIIK